MFDPEIPVALDHVETWLRTLPPDQVVYDNPSSPLSGCLVATYLTAMTGQEVGVGFERWHFFHPPSSYPIASETSLLIAAAVARVDHAKVTAQDALAMIRRIRELNLTKDWQFNLTYCKALANKIARLEEHPHD